MTFDEMAEWPHSRARQTVDMVRLTVKHPADLRTQVIVIEYRRTQRVDEAVAGRWVFS